MTEIFRNLVLIFFVFALVNLSLAHQTWAIIWEGGGEPITAMSIHKELTSGKLWTRLKVNTREPAYKEFLADDGGGDLAPLILYSLTLDPIKVEAPDRQLDSVLMSREKIQTAFLNDPIIHDVKRWFSNFDDFGSIIFLPYVNLYKITPTSSYPGSERSNVSYQGPMALQILTRSNLELSESNPHPHVVHHEVRYIGLELLWDQVSPSGSSRVGVSEIVGLLNAQRVGLFPDSTGSDNVLRPKIRIASDLETLLAQIHNVLTQGRVALNGHGVAVIPDYQSMRFKMTLLNDKFQSLTGYEMDKKTTQWLVNLARRGPPFATSNIVSSSRWKRIWNSCTTFLSQATQIDAF